LEFVGELPGYAANFPTVYLKLSGGGDIELNGRGAYDSPPYIPGHRCGADENSGGPGLLGDSRLKDHFLIVDPG
jgi:hypothetical protein